MAAALSVFDDEALDRDRQAFGFPLLGEAAAELTRYGLPRKRTAESFATGHAVNRRPAMLPPLQPQGVAVQRAIDVNPPFRSGKRAVLGGVGGKLVQNQGEPSMALARMAKSQPLMASRSHVAPSR